MSAEDEETRRKGWRRRIEWCLGIIIFLVIAYPLSVGPVVLLYRFEILTDTTFLEQVYSPLDWLAHRSPAVDHFFDWYVGLFLD